MSKSLHRLLDKAQPCKPIRADLRNSTVTFDWPENVLVRKEDYVIVPAQDVISAMADDDLSSIPLMVYSNARPSVVFFRQFLGYEAARNGHEYRVYFEFPGEVKENPRPSTWYGSETVTDLTGCEWSRTIGRMVMDDFGDLVPVTSRV